MSALSSNHLKMSFVPDLYLAAIPQYVDAKVVAVKVALNPEPPMHPPLALHNYIRSSA